jgi:hypothetical protein
VLILLPCALFLPPDRLGKCRLSCFVQALMLVLQFCPQLIHLRFDQAEGSVGLLDELVVALLWSARNQNIFSSDTGQRVETGTDASQRCSNVALQVGSFS